MAPKRRPAAASPPRKARLPSWPPWIHRVYQLLQDTTRALPKGAPAPKSVPPVVPKPPPEVEFSSPLRRGYLYRHSEEGVRAADFRPDGHTVVVNGRPCQADPSMVLRACGVRGCVLPLWVFDARAGVLRFCEC